MPIRLACPRTHGLVTALLALFASAAFGAGLKRAAAPPSDAGAELAGLCRQLEQQPLPFYGSATADALGRRLRDGGLSTTDRLELTARLGQELLQLGRLDEAIALLEPAADEARSESVDPKIRILLLSALTLSHLQAAEDRNCVLDGSAASCILPIGPDAVHRLGAHARAAGDRALEILSLAPRSFETAWVLNLARMLSADYPDGVPPAFRLPLDAFRSTEPFTPWHDRGRELGIDAVDLAGGAVMDDFDGDGLLDLVTSTWDPCDSLKAYRNDGQGGFEEVTRSWGLDEQLGGLNIVHADYDNDGDLDLLVLRGAWLFDAGRMRNSLLRNDAAGKGRRFADVTRAAGLAEPAYPTQTAAFSDIDGDGDLDLFVGNERNEEHAFPSQLFRNEGNGTFVDVAPALGVTNDRFTKAVAFGDADDDGDPDLFVSNHGPNRLYRNDLAQGGRFVDIADEAGVTGPDGWTFGSWFFDVDNDGDLDLFVDDYRATTEMVAASYFGIHVREGHPFLYRNDGDGSFTDVSAAWGLDRPLLPMGANYGDLDNDGFFDVYLGTGDPSFQSQVPNVMYRNRGLAGPGFADVTFAGGFGHLQKGHGVAFGDVDNDGDQDLLHQLGGFYPADAFRNALFENPGSDNAWVTLRFEGRRANRFAVGARVEARLRSGGSERSVHAVVGGGGSFGGSSLQLELGLGAADVIDTLVVRWPGSGLVQTFSAVAVRRVYRLVEGAESLEALSPPLLHLGGE